jgi:pimeloyl-ACP methyl ester carboxylesterase
MAEAAGAPHVALPATPMPRAAVGSVSVPVLVVRGPHDRVCPADWSEAVAQRGGAGSRAVTLSQGAHMVPYTHGELVAALVNELLDALPPGESPSSPSLGATDWVG